MVAYLPNFGGADNPINNEVAQRYIEQGIQESGAVNIVTGMILFYRAFDTFGESTVLFSAASAVLILLRIDTKDKQHFVSVDTDLAVKPRPDFAEEFAGTGSQPDLFWCLYLSSTDICLPAAVFRAAVSWAPV